METAPTSDQPEEITLSPVDQLLAIEEIKQRFAARLRIMDTKQWHLYPSVHTADMTSESWGAENRVAGIDAVTEGVRRTLDGAIPLTSVHHGHTPEITLTSNTTATGIWAMEDELWWDNEGTEEHLHGYGHYHEEYRYVNGRWLISFRTLSRIRVITTPNFQDYRTVNKPPNA